MYICTRTMRYYGGLLIRNARRLVTVYRYHVHIVFLPSPHAFLFETFSGTLCSSVYMLVAAQIRVSSTLYHQVEAEAESLNLIKKKKRGGWLFT